MRNRLLLVLLMATTAAMIGMTTTNPAIADPGMQSQKTAIAAISRYNREKREIIYYENGSVTGMGWTTVGEMADAYEGMQLAGVGNFMKNHPIIIIRKSIKSAGDSVNVVDEVIFPVWSVKNHAHVLRSGFVRYKTSIITADLHECHLGINGKRDMYIGCDGRTHFVK